MELHGISWNQIDVGISGWQETNAKDSDVTKLVYKIGALARGERAARFTWACWGPAGKLTEALLHAQASKRFQSRQTELKAKKKRPERPLPNLCQPHEALTKLSWVEGWAFGSRVPWVLRARGSLSGFEIREASIGRPERVPGFAKSLVAVLWVGFPADLFLLPQYSRTFLSCARC